MRSVTTLRPLDVASVGLDFNYEAHNASAYKVNDCARNVSATGEYLSVFLPNSYCACAETAISELLGNILTSSLASATPISYYDTDILVMV